MHGVTMKFIEALNLFIISFSTLNTNKVTNMMPLMKIMLIVLLI